MPAGNRNPDNNLESLCKCEEWAVKNLFMPLFIWSFHVLCEENCYLFIYLFIYGLSNDTISS
jgi:hypothetical protein